MLGIRYQICSAIGEHFAALLYKSTHTSITSHTGRSSFCATSCNNNLFKQRIATVRNIHYSNGKEVGVVLYSGMRDEDMRLGFILV